MYGSVELFQYFGGDKFMGFLFGELGQTSLGHLIKTGAVLFDDSQEKLVPENRQIFLVCLKLEEVVGEDGKDLFGEGIVFANEGFEIVQYRRGRFHFGHFDQCH